jgi:tRNA(Ile)-lysidine synthase
MSALSAALRTWLAAHPAGRLAVALSGGLDSTALLHALAQMPEARARDLRALHVDHGLHADSRRWARYCRELGASLQVPLRVMRVSVDSRSHGVEAGARHARYAAFSKALRRDEWLLTAQHADDQAETVLLKLLRGADLDGLAGMRLERALGRGRLARPLLDLPRAALHDHALEHSLTWILDPSNSEPRFDRGWLRTQVLPALKDRWPGAVAAICRSARHLQQERLRLETEIRGLLRQMQAPDGASLALEPLLALHPSMRHRLLLAWIGRLGWPAPSQGQLENLLQQLAGAPPSRNPALSWNGCSLRRHRQHLFAVAASDTLPAGWRQDWDLRRPLLLPDGSRLHVEGARIPRRRLSATSRAGGERIRLVGRAHSTSVKHALQALDLPPWRRIALPFLWDGDVLLAVGDLLLSAEFASWLQQRGLRLRWEKVDR